MPLSYDLNSNLKEILQNVSTIRSLINDRLDFRTHLAQSHEWNQICSSLNTIEDSSLAINAYWQVPFSVSSQNDGSAFLFIYGLLQSLYIQQDAIMDLASALGLKIDLVKEYTYIGQIRAKRNWAVGHPTKSHHPHNPKDSYHSTIPRAVISRSSFDLISSDSSGSLRQTVFTGDLCAGQSHDTIDALKRIAKWIEEKRNMFKSI